MVIAPLASLLAAVLAATLVSVQATYNAEEAVLGHGVPPPGALSSVGGGEEHSPPLYRPGSQAYVVSQLVPPLSPAQFWASSSSAAPELRNCALCEAADSGACAAAPSCVWCEPVATAACEHSVPCLRCAVIKNPFFKCTPGEKYMDECSSCRCADGVSGRCDNVACRSTLHMYAAALSDGEAY